MAMGGPSAVLCAATTALFSVLLLPTAVHSELIGDVGGPYAGGGVRFNEPQTAANYRRVSAYIRDVPRCSGLVTRLALGRQVSTHEYHEIALVFHSKWEAVCGVVASYNTTAKTMLHLEYLECVNPPGDATFDVVKATIAWTPTHTTYFLKHPTGNDVQIAQYTKALGGDPEESYRKYHDYSLTVHRSLNESLDGEPTTVCSPSALLVTKFEDTPFSNIFDDAHMVTRDMTARAVVPTASVNLPDWVDKDKWVFLNRHPLQRADEVILQNNVDITAEGVRIHQTLLDPYYDPTGVLVVQNNELNAFFQGHAGDTSFTNPAPWTTSARPDSVVRWGYDPFSTAGRGVLRFDIISTGQNPRGVVLSQDIPNFFFQARHRNNVATRATGPRDVRNAMEYCIFMELESSHARVVEVSLFPDTANGATLAPKFFGTWRVSLAVGAQQYSRCFAVNPDQQTFGGSLKLDILLGAVDGFFLVEHTLSFSSVRFYQLQGVFAGAVPAASEITALDWASTPQKLGDTTFASPVRWETKNSPSTSQLFWGSTGFMFDWFANTPLPTTNTITHRQRILLVKGKVYRFTLTGETLNNADLANPPGPNNVNSIPGRIVQVFIESSTGQRVFGGTMMARLDGAGMRTFDNTFVASEDSQLGSSADGTAVVRIYCGGLQFGGADSNPLLRGLSLQEWNRGLPQLPQIPVEPTLGSRTDKFTTDAPPSDAPTAAPPTAIPDTNAPPPPPPQIPKHFLDQKTLQNLYKVVYSTKLYMLEFENILVENINLDSFRRNFSSIMSETCLEMGFGKSCTMTYENVEILEVCYSNLRFPGAVGTSKAQDQRACRGMGRAVTYPYATQRDVNVTGVASYMVFTASGLDPAILNAEDGFEQRVIRQLNINIASEGLAIRPKGSAVPLTSIATLAPIDRTPESDYGLPNYAFMIILVVVLLLGCACGFNLWYGHKSRKMQRAAVTKELFKQGEYMPDYAPTMVQGLGMLQLNQLGMLKRQFDTMDVDAGGTLDKKEIRDVLRRLKVKTTEEEFVQFFHNIDTDGNEEIEFTEFSEGFIPFLVGQVRARMGSNNELDSKTEQIFAALSAERKTTSLFVDRSVDEHEGSDLMAQTPFLERRAAAIAPGTTGRHAARTANHVPEQPSSQSSTAPDHDTRYLRQGDRITVCEAKEKYAAAMEFMGKIFKPTDLPHLFRDVAGQEGVVLQVRSVEGHTVAQVDIPVMDEPYWMAAEVLDPLTASAGSHFLTKDERTTAKSYERWMVIRAIIGGLVSCALTAGAEHLLYNKFSDGSQTHRFRSYLFHPKGKDAKYWVLLVLAAIVFSILEMIFLYWDALRTTMREADVFGLRLHPLDEERSFYCRALSRCCLELGHPFEKQWAIVPMKHKTDVGKKLAKWAYNARKSVAAFAGRVTAKRLVSRVGIKLVQAWVGVPFMMVANGLVAQLVMSHARITTLGPRLIHAMLDWEREDDDAEPPLWYLFGTWVAVEHFERLRVNILRAIGCVVAARGEWHPNLETLYKTTRRKLGWYNEQASERMRHEAEQQQNKRGNQRGGASRGDESTASHDMSPREPAVGSERGDSLPGRLDPEAGAERALHEADGDEEGVWDELRLMQMMRRDCCLGYEMDGTSKLVQALRLDAHAAMERLELMGGSETDESGSEMEYDVLSSEDSSMYNDAYMTAFDQNEKCLILKFLVLAIIVSGKPSAATHRLSHRTFSAAGGDITNRPQKTIKALSHLYYQGNIGGVCKNFDLVFRAHRTMKGDKRSAYSRAVDYALHAVDW